MFLNYRDTLKPDPLWEEVAIYGGYRWIELPFNSKVWVSRRWEPHLAQLQDSILNNSEYNCNLSCMRSFRDMLADNGILLNHMQTYKSFDDVTSYSQLITVLKTSKYAKDVIFVNDPLTSINRLTYAFMSRDVVYAIGYSPLLDSLIDKGKVKSVVSDFLGYKCDVNYLSSDKLLSLTENHIVFVSNELYSKKALVRNWANVINFSKEIV